MNCGAGFSLQRASARTSKHFEARLTTEGFWVYTAAQWRHISMSKVKFFVLFSVVNCCLLFAQGERATISGTVTDSTGAVVPQVRITVRNERTNIVNKAESNSTGLYVAPALEPGSYELPSERQ